MGAKWKRCSTILATALLASACASGGAVPRWKGKLYVGDAEKDRFVHAKSGKEIRFDRDDLGDYVALSFSDLEALFNKYSRACESWRPDSDLAPADAAIADIKPKKAKK